MAHDSNRGGKGSLVVRLEHHGTHPGLHVHTSCQRSGIAVGPGGLDGLVRIPTVERPTYHRRKNAWTVNSFWHFALRFFRVEEEKGMLL